MSDQFLGDKDVYTIDQYADEFICVRKTVYNRIASGKIPPDAVLRLGGKIFIIKNRLKQDDSTGKA